MSSAHAHTAPSRGMVETQGRVFGLVAELDTPHALLDAVKAIREAGFEKIDTHTPFPVHGMDRAMGLSPTKLPWFVLVGGLTGTCSAFLLQWWMNAVDYPIRVGGKPFFSYQAYVPICFELTVLFSALTIVFTLFGLCRLPQPYHPLFTHDRFLRHSDDGFFVSIEASDPRWDETKLRAVLTKAGGKEITVIRELES